MRQRRVDRSLWLIRAVLLHLLLASASDASFVSVGNRLCSSSALCGIESQPYLHSRLSLDSTQKGVHDENGLGGVVADQQVENNSVRLNKVLKRTHSRREADRMIQDGRVTVNGRVSFGQMVVPFVDEIHLDGNLVSGWEEMNYSSSSSPDEEQGKRGRRSASSPLNEFEYIKYWKPRGVVCTTDRRIKYNIIDEITRYSGFASQHRVYPVGRLDKDTSGLILLTSDGRLPNASLRTSQKQPKVYHVRTDRPITDDILDHLRNGIVITTTAQRDGKAKPLTARTKPCTITLLSPNTCEITLMEGRNRQIRKMMEAVGLRALDLHRVKFGSIGLSDLRGEGDWQRLNPKEMKWVKRMVLVSTAPHDTSGTRSTL